MGLFYKPPKPPQTFKITDVQGNKVKMNDGREMILDVSPGWAVGQDIVLGSVQRVEYTWLGQITIYPVMCMWCKVRPTFSRARIQFAKKWRSFRFSVWLWWHNKTELEVVEDFAKKLREFTRRS